MLSVVNNASDATGTHDDDFRLLRQKKRTYLSGVGEVELLPSGS
jgi:hypothetical protein